MKYISLFLMLTVTVLFSAPATDAFAEEELFLPVKKIFLTPDDDGAIQVVPKDAVDKAKKQQEEALTPEHVPSEKDTAAKKDAAAAKSTAGTKSKAASKTTVKVAPEKTAKTAPAVKPAPKKVAKPAPKAQPAAKKAATKLVEKMVMELAGDTVLVHLTTNAPIQKSRFFFTSTGKLVVDVSGRWHKKGPSKMEFKEGPVADITTGEHADKFRIVLRWKEKPAAKVLPILQVTDSGMSIIVPVPAFQ